MNGYRYLRPGPSVGELTPAGGAVVAIVALGLAAAAFAYMGSTYRPSYPQLRPRRRGA